MKINKRILLAAGAFVTLFSFNACNQANEDDILQRWQVTSIESSMSDSMYKEQNHFIDTLSIVTEEMIDYFETDDLDEVKAILKGQLEEDKEVMSLSSDMLSLEFLKDNKVIFHSFPESDTATYSFTDDKKAINIVSTDGAHTERFDIDKLNSSNLIISQSVDNNKTTLNLRVFDEDKDKNKAEDAFNKINEKMMQSMGGMEMNEMDETTEWNLDDIDFE